MGEYMQACIFKEISDVSFFSNKKDILFKKLKEAKSKEEKDLIAKEFALYDNEKNINLLDILNPIYWDYNNKSYVTYDGMFGLYNIFPPIHQYYKYYMPNGWLVLTKPEEFELSKTFGKAIIPISLVKKRLNLLLSELKTDSEIKSFFTNKITGSTGYAGMSIQEMIDSSRDNDYLYLNLGNIYNWSEGDEPRNIAKEIETIQNKREEIINTYNLKNYMNSI